MEDPHGLAITVHPASFQDAGLGWVRSHGLKTRGFETLPLQGREFRKDGHSTCESIAYSNLDLVSSGPPKLVERRGKSEGGSLGEGGAGSTDQTLGQIPASPVVDAISIASLHNCECV